MARIRTIKPEFWRNEDLSALPEATVLLAAALLNYADDEGYFNANCALIKAECSPLREPSVSIPESLTHLSKIGYVILGATENGKRYGRVEKFCDHQRVSHPTASKIKELHITWEGSANPHGSLPNGSALNGKEGNREQGKEIPTTSGAEAPQLPTDVLWTRGVLFMVSHGTKEANARTLIGKWLRDHEAELVVKAFAAAKQANTGDPVAYIEKALGSIAKRGEAESVWTTVTQLARDCSTASEKADEYTNAAIHVIGGWRAIGRATAFEMTALKKQFVEAYGHAKSTIAA